MAYRPGDTLYRSFSTRHLTGGQVDADSLPSAVLRWNGTNTGVTVGITRNAVGDYTASCVIPATYSPDDTIEVIATATVDTITESDVIFNGQLTERRDYINSSVNDGSPTATSFKGASALSTTDNAYTGMWVCFTSGVLTGIPQMVSTYTGSTRGFTFSSGFPNAPANGDYFVIIGRAT